MNISILGCGWLGFPVAQEMIKWGYQVSGSTTREEKLSELKNAGISPYLIKLDSEWDGSTGDFFESDVLMVSIPPKRKSADPESYFHQMCKLIKVLKSYSVKKVLFISSTSVYPATQKIVTEEDANNNSLLGRVENLFQTSYPNTTIIRFGGLVGPGRHPGRFLSGKNVLAHGESPVNLIHIEDCIGIIIKIVKDQIWGEVLNACASKHPTKKSFYETASKSLGLVPPVFVNEGIISKVVENARLKDVLGYQFLYDDPMDMI